MQQTFPCPKCGSHNVIGAPSCQACSESFKYTCPQCGIIVDTKFKGCAKCGAILYWPIHDQVESPSSGRTRTSEEPEINSEAGRPRQKKRNPILIVGLAIIGTSLLVGLAIMIFFQGTLFTFPTGTSSSETESTATETTEITAEKLLQAYRTDKNAAEAEYKGRILKVTGVVSSVSKNFVGTTFIKLAGVSIEAYRVQCMFDKEHEPELAQMTKGDTITIRGTCDEYLPPDITMKECVLVR